MNSQPTKTPSNAPNTWGVACRPTVLFVVAFAFCVTPHEAVHAITSYLLGFSSTLFQMWVNPDSAEATPRQLAIIAATGPIFSLLVGVGSWVLYRRQYCRMASGLVLLMLTVVGVYSFLGPLAGSALGGDFYKAFIFLGISKLVRYLASAIGFALLPSFMFVMGKKLVRWAPTEFGRAKTVARTTVAPWLIGTMLIVLVYWPLPATLIRSTIGGSVFWAFAVLGAALCFPASRPVETTSSFTRSDLIITILAVVMVRALASGVRLAH